jgi:serpin B
MALGMTSEGAAGATAQQMRAALRLPATNQSFASLASRLNAHDPACEISVANSLWGHNGTMIDPRFIGRVKASFGAGFEQIDFADPTRASDAINHWVAERTHDRIQNLIASDAIRPDGRLVLANAVYFKGAWRDPFEEGMTSDQDFFPAGANRIRAPFMYRAGSYRYAEDAGAQVLELPYGGKDLSMWVILPRRPGGLASLEKTLTRTTLAGWIEKSKAREVEVRVPRFRLETQYSLRAPLEALGIRDAFAPARADFSGIDGRRDLFIGLVAHKAFVEVNEKGTEAAAATGIVMREVSARVGPPPVVFRADHPFLFVIREAGTGAIVFIGRLADPRG